MARIRAIKPEFAFDEELSKLPIETRLFFILLWTHADREGRLEDRPQVLRAKIYPYDSDKDADSMLAMLHPKFVFRYESGGRKYLQVMNWHKHQLPHYKEVQSTIPAPKFNIKSTSVQHQVNVKATSGQRCLLLMVVCYLLMVIC